MAGLPAIAYRTAMSDRVTDWGHTDLELMQHAAVSLFWQPHVLDETCEALTALSYEVTTIDCLDGWDSFRLRFSALLKWDDLFGYAPWTGGLDALNDGLSGYPFPPSNRAALALTGFHALIRDNRRASEVMLDLLEAHSRNFLLFSQRLIVLVQTDDARFEAPIVGGKRPLWNRQEWSLASRGL